MLQQWIDCRGCWTVWRQKNTNCCHAWAKNTRTWNNPPPKKQNKQTNKKNAHRFHLSLHQHPLQTPQIQQDQALKLDDKDVKLFIDWFASLLLWGTLEGDGSYHSTPMASLSLITLVFKSLRWATEVSYNKQESFEKAKGQGQIWRLKGIIRECKEQEKLVSFSVSHATSDRILWCWAWCCFHACWCGNS